MEELNVVYDFFKKWYKELLFGFLFIVFMQACSISCSVNKNQEKFTELKKEIDSLENKQDSLNLQLNEIKESNLTKKDFIETNKVFVYELLKYEKAIDDKKIKLSDIELNVKKNNK